jgi:hypothetical protein
MATIKKIDSDKYEITDDNVYRFNLENTLKLINEYIHLGKKEISWDYVTTIIIKLNKGLISIHFTYTDDYKRYSIRDRPEM